MSDARPNRLPPELESVLEAERKATSPEESLDRVWSRLEASLVAGGPQAPSGGPTNGSGRFAARWLASHGRTVAVSAFVAGALVGAGMHAALMRAPRDRVVYVDRPTPAAIEPPRAVPEAPVPAASHVPEIVPRPHPLPPRTASAPSASSSLSEERKLLDRARVALAQNDGARAFVLTEDHARRFPHPALGEEREAIAIQALVLDARYDEARARASRFQAASPNSLFLPALDASLSSIP